MGREKSLPSPLGLPDGTASNDVVMKNIKHLVLGLVASLLLAVGFARAADRVDLSAQDLSPELSKDTLLASKPCTEPCDMPRQ